MRLLDTSTLRFEEFLGKGIPRYAILSHTWGTGEVSFQDMQDVKGKDKGGYSKITSCCALAASDGWKYVWIDTCCIDKTSSAELSEAINSMFEWYKNAAVCYAYLADIFSPEVYDLHKDSGFQESRWFTRGWTLQELLAPSMVIFYDRDWKEIGTKSSLSAEISDKTGIARSDFLDFKDANVAVKMSWASGRETTRVEDTAYCLLGLFGVNMPLLYGEGTDAFIRLQLEILKISDDETIFAWEGHDRTESGLLASSPADFSGSGDIRKILFDKDRLEYSMTNKGLRIELPLLELSATEIEYTGSAGIEESDGKAYTAPLNCTRHPEDIPLEIYLKSDVKVKFVWLDSDTDHNHPKQLTRCRSVDGKRLGTVPETSLRDYLGKKKTVVYVKQMSYVSDDDQIGESIALHEERMASIRYPATLFPITHVWSASGIVVHKERRVGDHMIQLHSERPVGVMFDGPNKHRERFAVFLRRYQMV
jgi:hypothetical protein